MNKFAYGCISLSKVQIKFENTTSLQGLNFGQCIPPRLVLFAIVDEIARLVIDKTKKIIYDLLWKDQ